MVSDTCGFARFCRWVRLVLTCPVKVGPAADGSGGRS